MIDNALVIVITATYRIMKKTVDTERSRPPRTAPTGRQTRIRYRQKPRSSVANNQCPHLATSRSTSTNCLSSLLLSHRLNPVADHASPAPSPKPLRAPNLYSHTFASAAPYFQSGLPNANQKTRAENKNSLQPPSGSLQYVPLPQERVQTKTALQPRNREIGQNAQPFKPKEAYQVSVNEQSAINKRHNSLFHRLLNQIRTEKAGVL